MLRGECMRHPTCVSRCPLHVHVMLCVARRLCSVVFRLRSSACCLFVCLFVCLFAPLRLKIVPFRSSRALTGRYVGQIDFRGNIPRMINENLAKKRIMCLRFIKHTLNRRLFEK